MAPAFIGKLLALFRIEQHTFGRDIYPNQTGIPIFKTMRAG
jgi:hypothetical protein